MLTTPDTQPKARLGEATRTLLLFGGLSVVAFAFLAFALSLGVTQDASSFLVVAQRWLEGYWPYVGTFDNKPPLFYVLMLPAYLLSLVVGPALALALNWAAWCGALGICLRALLRQLGVSAPGALLAALAVTALSANPQLSQGGGNSETPAAVFLVLACFWTLRPGRWAPTMAGLSLGAAALISLWAIPFGALVAVNLWLGRRQIGPWLKAGLAVLTSAGLLIALAVAILALAGALGAAIHDIFDYNRAYLVIRPCSFLVYSGWPCGAPVDNLISIGGTVLAWLGFGLLGLTLWRRQAASVLLATLWLGLFIALTLPGGRLAPQYGLQAVVPLAIFAGLGLEALNTWRHRLIKLTLLGLSIWLAIFVNLVLTQSFAHNDADWTGVHNQRAAGLADWLAQNTNADTPYWLWGSDTAYLYLLLPREPLDPNVNLYGLITPGWATPQMGTQLACSLARHQGLVVEDTANSGMPGLLTIGHHPYYANVLDPVRTLVRDHYHQIGQIDGFIIYAPLPGYAPVANCP